MLDDNEGYSSNYQLYTDRNNASYSPVNVGDSHSPQDSSVSVPDSYHVGAYHSPVSFKARDKSWVSEQNPQEYTIQLAESEKAAQVARKLYQTPKADRMGQVKCQINGQSYFKGVYGSYSDADSAEKALEGLPEEIKQGASIKNWAAIQQNME